MCPGALPNLTITGFMGTGKTSVGRAVAQRLGRSFVDMDGEIEARAGKPIPCIFAEDGEATFRRMEAALCEELGGRKSKGGRVIATGGGALVDPSNRAAMMASGPVVCLTCETDEIPARLSAYDRADRPLLHVADPRAEIGRLLAERREAYEAIPWQIDTSGLSIEDVVERVLQLVDVVTLPVRYLGGEYPIHIGCGLLSHLGGALRAAGVPERSRVAVVCNPVVSPLYGAQVHATLQAARFLPVACPVPDGEQHKTLDTVAALYDRFLAGGLGRGDTVLSLGGGVTGDIAGLAAATYLRGVRFVQVPTTLLAMVDASVGGKTGVDLPQGKNLVGAFKQPVLVVVDPSVLATLPPEEVRSGVAETIKHGVIGAPDLFEELEAAAGNLPLWWEEGVSLITRALQVKIDVVEEDPLEEGRRAALNLGHTIGHGLEKLSGFSLRHGEAVGIGMIAAAHIAGMLGCAESVLAARLTTILAAWGLPVRCPPFDIDAIWAVMAYDKKRRGWVLRWVLPYDVGHVEITDDVPFEVVRTVLRTLGARG
jgi:shikimate kinase/3-dehydroquinate synthase